MQSGSRSSKVNSAVINVCLSNFVKSIKCDVPCSEGYPPGNLITNNFIERCKGFLAERFLKPPVSLTLELESEIDIKYVVVSCCVGAQKSKGLELFFQTVETVSNGSYLVSVASGVLPDDKIGFVFHRFNVNVKERFGEQYCFRTFKSSRYLSLVNVVKIKIFCTSGTSIPAIGKIEIWGIPLKSLPLTHDGNTKLGLQHQAKICQKVSQESFMPAITKPSGSKVLQPSHILSKRAELDHNFTIPDDFIDPITCEVMIQPMILPSGNVVDSSTLKSHEKAELRWGRGPSDPFTGIPFSFKGPILALDLKSRIDKFLSDNCNVSELQNIPRTLGTNGSFHILRKPTCDVVVSSLVKKTNLKCQGKSPSTFSCYSAKLPEPNQFKPSTASKRKHSQIDSDGCSTVEFCLDSRNNPGPSSQSSSTNHIDNRSYAADGSETFQERMDQSLEMALKSTLSKLPKFSDNVNCFNEVSRPTVLCNTCASIESLFSIPCNHFVCRSCLLKVKKDEILTVCLLCKFKYKTSDVQKVHTRQVMLSRPKLNYL